VTARQNLVVYASVHVSVRFTFMTTHYAVPLHFCAGHTSAVEGVS